MLPLFLPYLVTAGFPFLEWRAVKLVKFDGNGLFQ